VLSASLPQSQWDFYKTNNFDLCGLIPLKLRDPQAPRTSKSLPATDKILRESLRTPRPCTVSLKASVSFNSGYLFFINLVDNTGLSMEMSTATAEYRMFLAVLLMLLQAAGALGIKLNCIIVKFIILALLVANERLSVPP
jgi:hypothetical protein